MKKFTIIQFSLFFLLFSPAMCLAQVGYWSGNAGDLRFNNPTNWGSSLSPSTYYIFQFSPTGPVYLDPGFSPPPYQLRGLELRNANVSFNLNGQTLDVTQGDLRRVEVWLGSSLEISNGNLLSSHGAVGYTNSYVGEVTISNGGVWDTSGPTGSLGWESLMVGGFSQNGSINGGGTGTVNVVGGGQLVSGVSVVGITNGSQIGNGTMNVAGAGSNWSATDIYLGGSRNQSTLGTGIINVFTGGSVNANNITFYTNGEVNLNGGTLNVNNLHFNPGSTFNFNAGNLNFTSNHVFGGSELFKILGGTNQLTSQQELTVSGNATVNTNLQLAGGIFGATGDIINNANITGFGIVIGNVTGNPLSNPSGGNVNRTTNFDLGNRTANVLSVGFANLGPFTTMNNGTINAPNGLFLQGASNFEGSGVINAKIAASFGSTINATGNLTLGDSSAFDGFTSDGVLNVNNHNVTINDANQAVLGSLTTLGQGGSPGMLNVANGAVIEFGKNVTGYGAINSVHNPADPTTALLNNGSIIGDSMANPITLSGFVKGVGFMDNVVITGTYSQGLSPAAVTVGDLAFVDASTVIMELEGTTAGSEYDVLTFSGNGTLDGTLQINLLNGFNPQAGDSFDLFEGSFAGSFDNIILPTLDNGLAWNTSNLQSFGSISVQPIPEPSTMLLLGIAGLGSTVYYRRRKNLAIAA